MRIQLDSLHDIVLNCTHENLNESAALAKSLAMIAPISNEEKQTILESVHIDSKTQILSEIIEFYLHDKSSENITLQ